MNLTKKIYIACSCVIIFSACKKDNPTPDNYISFKVNGVYKRLKPEADYFDDGSLLLDANEGKFLKDEISFSTIKNPQVKTYHFEDPDADAIADYNNHAGTDFWCDSGTLVISEVSDNHISGTFAFKGHAVDDQSSKINITEGQFSASVSFLSFAPDTCAWRDSTYGVSKRVKLMNSQLNRRQLAVPMITGGRH